MLIVIGFSVLCFILPSLAWTGYLIFRNSQLAKAVGRVVQVEGANGISTPVVEFTLPNGQKVAFEDKRYTNDESSGELEFVFDFVKDLYHKNILGLNIDEGEVLVYYNPKNPQDARLAANNGWIIAPLSLLVVGTCLILYSIPATNGVVQALIKFIETITNSQ